MNRYDEVLLFYSLDIVETYCTILIFQVHGSIKKTSLVLVTLLPKIKVNPCIQQSDYTTKWALIRELIDSVTSSTEITNGTFLASFTDSRT